MAQIFTSVCNLVKLDLIQDFYLMPVYDVNVNVYVIPLISGVLAKSLCSWYIGNVKVS